ncbi:MAG TPA: thioredoxin family protein [Gaiellaceae bacterium]|nr:thioredoxin family protein [Gaiellaceae bacterium]
MIDGARPSTGPEQPLAREDAAGKPRLVFFHSPTSGRCRRAEGHLAQALQRRHNHETFELVRVDVDTHPELARQFQVTELPTFVVVEGRQAVRRIVSPRGARELGRELAEWLS